MWKSRLRDRKAVGRRYWEGKLINWCNFIFIRRVSIELRESIFLWKYIWFMRMLVIGPCPSPTSPKLRLRFTNCNGRSYGVLNCGTKGLADSTSLLVLAPMFQLSAGCGLTFLDTIVNHLPNISYPGLSVTLPSLDLSAMTSLFTNTSINTFIYSGSLTTPPCSEGVIFLIPDERLPITVDQFNALKSVIKFNARYTQNRVGDGNLIQIA